MEKIKTLTLKDHDKTANDLAIAVHLLERIVERCEKKCIHNRKLIKIVHQVLLGWTGFSGRNAINEVHAELEEEYLKVYNPKGKGKMGSCPYDNPRLRYEIMSSQVKAAGF